MKDNYLTDYAISSYLFFGFTLFSVLMNILQLSPQDAARITGWVFGAMFFFFLYKIYRQKRKR